MGLVKCRLKPAARASGGFQSGAVGRYFFGRDGEGAGTDLPKQIFFALLIAAAGQTPGRPMAPLAAHCCRTYAGRDVSSCIAVTAGPRGLGD